MQTAFSGVSGAMSFIPTIDNVSSLPCSLPGQLHRTALSLSGDARRPARSCRWQMPPPPPPLGGEGRHDRVVPFTGSSTTRCAPSPPALQPVLPTPGIPPPVHLRAPRACPLGSQAGGRGVTIGGSSFIGAHEIFPCSDLLRMLREIIMDVHSHRAAPSLTPPTAQLPVTRTQLEVTA